MTALHEDPEDNSTKLTAELLARINAIIYDLDVHNGSPPKPMVDSSPNLHVATSAEQSLPTSAPIAPAHNEEYSPPSSIASSPCISPRNIAIPLPVDSCPATNHGWGADLRLGGSSTSRAANVGVEEQGSAIGTQTKASSVVSSKPPTEVSTLSFSKDSNDGNRSGVSDPSTVKGDVAVVVTPNGIKQVYKERAKDPSKDLPPTKRPLPIPPTPLDIRAIKASHRSDELRRLSPSRTRNGKGRLNALSKDQDGYETADEVRKRRIRRWQS